MGGLDNTPATPAAECVTNQNTGEDYQFGDVVPDSCCQMADMHGDIESHFSNREAPCGLFPLQYQPSAFQFPLFSTAYCDSPNHVIYEEVHCQQTDQRCGGCVSTFSHEFHGPVCVKLTDFPGQPQKYYGWFEGCADHDDHSASLVNSHTEIRAHGDHFTSVSGSYAIYGLDNTPATPSAQCVTNENTGEDYQFGDVVPDSCCQMADMHGDIESHFSNRESPCGLFPLQYQPSAFQFPLFSTAYCDSPNHVIYEEVHCQHTDQRCGGCASTFSHEFHGPVCVKLTDFPGQPQKYY